jgi:hypothetical protein
LLILVPIQNSIPSTHYTDLDLFNKMARTHPFSIGLVALSLLCSVVMSALVQVTDFGGNPTGLQMYINVPAKLATKPAVILAVGLASNDVENCG